MTVRSKLQIAIEDIAPVLQLMYSRLPWPVGSTWQWPPEVPWSRYTNEHRSFKVKHFCVKEIFLQIFQFHKANINQVQCVSNTLCSYFAKKNCFTQSSNSKGWRMFLSFRFPGTRSFGSDPCVRRRWGCLLLAWGHLGPSPDIQVSTRVKHQNHHPGTFWCALHFNLEYAK